MLVLDSNQSFATSNKQTARVKVSERLGEYQIEDKNITFNSIQSED